MTIGRPSKFTQALADAICEALAGGDSLRTICLGEDMPDARTVYRWVEKNETFRQQYTRARELQLERWADELVDISDDGSNDWMTRQTKNGDSESVVDHEHITRSRLRIDTRKWILAKLAPKKYGEFVRTELTGKDGGPIENRVVASPADLKL